MQSENMELRLISPTEDGFVEKIQWNSDEIKKAVAEMVKDYKGLVYTEDTVQSAKSDRASLNKLKKAIDDRRKEIKKKCLEPYEEFEREVKEVLAIIEEPIGLIDSQIKGFEDRQKEEKRQKLKAVYDENIGDLANMFSFERLMQPTWLNATVTLKKATAELTDKIESIANDLVSLERTVDEKYKTAVVAKYVQTMDCSAAMGEHYRLKQIDEEMEKRRIAEEAQRAEAEARKAEMEAMRKAEAENAAATPEPEAPVPPAPPVMETVPEPQIVEEPKKECRFYVRCTKTQLLGIVGYLKEHGIEYGSIK